MSDRYAPHPASWPEPEPLPSDLPLVQPLDFDLLPLKLRPWIEDIAERIQCPPDFPAVGAMVAMAGLVGRKLGIRPKRHDEWLVVPNLWGAAIGRPGLMKSPALEEPLKPLKRLEIDAKNRYSKELEDYQAAKMVSDAKRKLSERGILKAVEENEAMALEMARTALKGDGNEPVRRRYLVNDPTVEKLGEILNQNPQGVTVYRDELIGLLKSLDKDGQEGARAFYLEAWNGTNRYTYDRIGRGTIDIESATVSIVGGIQPGPLKEYLREAVQGGRGDDGLMQRFQLAVWPDNSRHWKNVDRWPDSVAKLDAWETFVDLNELNAESVGAEYESGEAIPWLRFHADAQTEFDRWRAGLEWRLRNDAGHPVMESHLAKFRSLIPSLALLTHLADNGSGPVTADALTRAIAWGAYLESHARRIYSVASKPELASARALAEKIRSGELENGFALRDVYRPCWAGLARRDEAAAATELLVDRHWLRPVEEMDTGGRPCLRHYINPKILPGDAAAADKTDRTSPKPLEGGSFVSSDSSPLGMCRDSQDEKQAERVQHVAAQEAAAEKPRQYA